MFWDRASWTWLVSWFSCTSFIGLCSISGLCCFVENCPDQNPRLRNWDPGQDSAKHIVIKEGDLFRLTSDATVDSIVIQDGGR